MLKLKRQHLFLLFLLFISVVLLLPIKQVFAADTTNCKDSKGINWKLELSEGKVVKLSTNDVLSGTVNIPEAFVINNKTYKVVTVEGFEIRKSIFTNETTRSKVTKVIIPDTVTTIGNYAFYECFTLGDVVFSDKVSSFGYGCFYECNAIKKFKLPASVKEIPPYMLFRTSITSIEIPEDSCLESIGEYAFGCTKLTEFPCIDSLRSIGKMAFIECANLKSAYFLKTVTSNLDYSFFSCPKLETVALNGTKSITPKMFQNENMSNVWLVDSIDPNINSYMLSEFTKDFTLYLSNCDTIPSNAFKNCSHVKRLVLDKVPTSIGANAFSGCNIDTLVIHGDVTADFGQLIKQIPSIKRVLVSNASVIESGAFKDCKNITYFGFLGTPISEYLEGNRSLLFIGDNAFNGCTSLAKVDLPDTVQGVGHSAFRGCTSLTSFSIPANCVTVGTCAFEKCTSLSSIAFNSKLSSLGSWAFAGCTSLQGTIKLPNTLKKIDSYTFSECSRITGVQIPSSIATIADHAFSDCSSLTGTITLSEGLKSIENYAFFNCSNLQGINFPKSLQVLGEFTFANCKKLSSSLVIPEAITVMPTAAFSNCSSLQSVSLGSKSQSVSDLAFYNCSALKNATGVTSNIKSVGLGSFANCSTLTSIGDLAKVSTVGHSAFLGCTSLGGSVSLGAIGTVPEGCFAGCSNLTKVSASSSVANVNPFAFTNCAKLQQVPASVNTAKIVNKYAFSGCNSMQNITIPSSATRIEKYAFFNCKGAKNKLSLPTNVEFVGISAFDGCTNLAGLALNQRLDVLGECAFYRCGAQGVLSIPANVGVVPRFCFANCTKLTGIKMAEGTTMTAAFAFFNDSGLVTSLELPKSVATVGRGSFAYSSLPSVTLYGTTSIDSISFKSCNKLLTFNIVGNPVTKFNLAIQWAGSVKNLVLASAKVIPANAFKSCSSLVFLEMFGGIESADKTAFDGCTRITTLQVNSDVSTGFNGVVKNIPSVRTVKTKNTTTIYPSAFANCSQITAINFNDGLQTINKNAFQNCTGLPEIVFPATLKIVGDDAFSSCTSLKALVLPTSITNLGTHSFKGCTGLSTVDWLIKSCSTSEPFYGCSALKTFYYGKDVTALDSSIFSGVENLTTFVPINCK